MIALLPISVILGNLNSAVLAPTLERLALQPIPFPDLFLAATSGEAGLLLG
jgi:hypothetical protein